MPVLERTAGNIRYQVTGNAGPALLLSHGFGATSAMFAGNVPALADTHRVVTWDLRGHGGSEYPADPDSYSSANALADMGALLAELGVDGAVLGGHSLGGYLSLQFTLAFPERVTGLVLIDTGPGFRNDAARDEWNRQAHRTAARLTERGLAGLGGSPASGQRRAASANASWAASSAMSMSPKTRTRTATARPYSARNTRSMSAALAPGMLSPRPGPGTGAPRWAAW